MQGPDVRDALLKAALKGYPGARDPEGPIGKGVREVFGHVVPGKTRTIKSST